MDSSILIALNFLTTRRLIVVLTVAIILVFMPNNSSLASPLFQSVRTNEYQVSHSDGQLTPNASAFIRVPQDTASLQQAIAQVSNGGIIELANGTYSAPAPEGFELKNIGKSFTIQAAAGATVVLSGNNANPIISFLNTDISAGGLVTFKGLTFANGRYNADGRAGGISMYKARARFIDCRFENNLGNQPSTGGGGILVVDGSTASFSNCVWERNYAKNEGGGMAVNSNATVTIYNSQFVGNRTNLPGHRLTSGGGAIHVGNASLTVYDTIFEGNEAGYVGGAVFVIGNWTNPVSTPRSQVNIVRSTFLNNQVLPDPAVVLNFPTEGGAFHAEDQTTAQIMDSVFTGNKANTGGAVNLYRAIVSINTSVFKENKATGIGAA
ncbi:MAG TPA: hypothetical protein PKE64_30625, partial [Anaerolineae bacterium]|nr:hypothetical protein [Anaerolineae bacterium]